MEATEEAEKHLADILPHVRNRRSGSRQHVLLVTDGVPTQGDPEALVARAAAQKSKVSIHTVFLGAPEYFPATLEAVKVEPTSKLLGVSGFTSLVVGRFSILRILSNPS